MTRYRLAVIEASLGRTGVLEVLGRQQDGHYLSQRGAEADAEVLCRQVEKRKPLTATVLVLAMESESRVLWHRSYTRELGWTVPQQPASKVRTEADAQEHDDG